MSGNALYHSITQAKDGSPIPLFSSGRSLHSRYNPVREAEQIAGTISSSCSFIVFAGFGAGYVAAAVLKRSKHIKILAAEQDEQSITFLRSIPAAANVMDDPRVVVFPVADTERMIVRNYLPAVYGDMQILELRPWMQESTANAELFRSLSAAASRRIAADFSVQAHFGALWQRNIMCNLRYCHPAVMPLFPVAKTALVAAAGPSLDTTCSYIVAHRDELYVIATDTAYGSFCRRGISCDAVVSIDAQNISHSHFIGSPARATLFIFDLCAHPASVRYADECGGTVVFASSGHPLAEYARTYALEKMHQSFLSLDSGAGTVTLSAVDFALQAGFSTILIAGADFAYTGGKPYMRGTYLDALYYGIARRTFTAENQFDRLIYRTPLLSCRNGTHTYSTELLDSYRKSLEHWCAEHSLSYVRKNGFWMCRSSTGRKDGLSGTLCGDFDFSAFRARITADIKSDSYDDSLIHPLTQSEYAVLPYAAYLLHHYTGTVPFSSLLKLANSDLLRYTE